MKIFKKNNAIYKEKDNVITQISEEEMYTIISEEDFNNLSIKAPFSPVYAFTLLFETHFRLKKSVFGERIYFVPLEENFDFIEINKENFFGFEGNISFAYNICSEKTKECLKEYTGTFTGLRNPVNLIPKDFKFFLQTAMNGIFCTPQERDEFIRLIEKWLKKSDTDRERYICDECGQKFKDVNKILEHLYQTKHKDSFIEKFPYYDFSVPNK